MKMEAVDGHGVCQRRDFSGGGTGAGAVVASWQELVERSTQLLNGDDCEAPAARYYLVHGLATLGASGDVGGDPGKEE
jgi:hypothetical protein